MNPASATSDIVSTLQNWASKPFSEDMDLTHWALFVGLVACLSLLWKLVLNDLKGELE